jgi:hypothetical protein
MRVYAIGAVAAITGFFVGQHAIPALEITSAISFSGTTSGGYAPEVMSPLETALLFLLCCYLQAQREVSLMWHFHSCATGPLAKAC